MSNFVTKNDSPRLNIKRNKFDLPKLQEILRQKCQQQIRERRYQLLNKRRFELLSPNDVQETLTEIVRQEFSNLGTTEKSDIDTSTKTIINSPLDFEEALNEENYLIAEQEQWILQEYERLLQSEEQMFDMLEDEVLCPMCQKSFLEEIPDFISCDMCGLKIRTEISLNKFKYYLELYVNMHSNNCLQVPQFSLVLNNNNTSLQISCLACSKFFVISTIET
ncbi:hypothetical protein TKK_0012406 [Trichogramma kaykai]|uniref:RPA-interacting protein C-terminal domain-containing protein n=1 Tax=Trichogramma kaykai TaxID=54128 RepID=A0ABD2WPX7_9HYME